MVQHICKQLKESFECLDISLLSNSINIQVVMISVFD